MPHRIIYGTIAALVLPTSSVWSQMPLDGAPLAQPGRYEVISEVAVGSPRHIVFRPANLNAFPQEDTLPVVASGRTAGARLTVARTPAF